MSKVKTVPTCQAFLEALGKSRLIGAETLQKIAAGLGNETDPTNLAKQLIKDRVLTRWQAQQLLAGVTALTVGPYRLYDLRDKDAISRTYLAQRATDRKLVALKVLTSKSLQDQELAKAFGRDAKAAVEIEHPALNRIVDAVAEKERGYVAAELPEGKDLQSLVAEGSSLSLEQVSGLLRQLGSAVAALHAKGVLHLDIRPANVFQTKSGDWKLWYAPGGRAVATAAPDPAAAPESLAPNDFAAPELFDASFPADVRSDLYALGLTVLYAATGKLPFVGTNEERRALRQQADAPPIENLVPACPPALARALARLTTQAIAQRWESSAVMLQALEDDSPAVDVAAAPVELEMTEVEEVLDLAAIEPSVAESAAEEPAALAVEANAPAAVETLDWVEEPGAQSAPEAPQTPPAPSAITSDTVSLESLEDTTTIGVSPAASVERPVPQLDTAATPPNRAAAESADGMTAGPVIQVDGKPTRVAAISPTEVKISKRRKKKAPSAEPAGAEETGQAAPTPRRKLKPGILIAGGSGIGLVITAIIAVVIFMRLGGDSTPVAATTSDGAGTESGAVAGEGGAEGQAAPSSAEVVDAVVDVVPDVVGDEPPATATPAPDAVAAAPTTPAAAPAAPSTLAPSTPAPATPAPAAPTPAPTTPEPATPAPAPTTPAPTTPAPATPAPTEPAQPVVVAKVEAKPEPAKKAAPGGKPFREFPTVIDLPPFGSTEEKVLGPIYIGDRDLCLLRLKGADTVTRGKQKLAIANANNGTAERDWEITFGQDGGGDVVANLSIKDQKLVFQWTDKTTQPALSAAENLRNLALNMSAGPETHDLALRAPLKVKPMSVNLEKGDAKERWIIGAFPPPETLKLEITSLGGKKFLVEPAGGIDLSKGDKYIWFGEKPDDAVFGFKLDATLGGKNLQISLLPQFRTMLNPKPENYNKANFKKMEKVLVALPQVRAQFTQLQQNPKKDQLQNQILQAQQDLAKLEAGSRQHDLITELAKEFKNGCDVQIRLSYTAEDKNVVLLESDPNAP